MSRSPETVATDPIRRRVATAQNAYTLVLSVVSGTFAVLAWSLGIVNDRGQPGPGMIPFFAAVGLFVATLYLLIRQVAGNTAVLAAAGSTGEAVTVEDRRTTVVAGALVAGYLILMPLIGIWASTILYCIVSSIQLNTNGRAKAALLTLVVPLGILAVFDIGFGLRLPEGLMFS